MFNADKIRELRLRENLTTEELSKRILVSRPAITKWENRRTMPNAENLGVLAEYFGVSVEAFFEKPPQSGQPGAGENGGADNWGYPILSAPNARGRGKG